MLPDLSRSAGDTGLSLARAFRDSLPRRCQIWQVQVLISQQACYLVHVLKSQYILYPVISVAKVTLSSRWPFVGHAVVVKYVQSESIVLSKID